jgi:hypothetical protein
MKIFLTTFLSLATISFLQGQQLTFQDTYGGTMTDVGSAVVAVSNGYVVVGTTNTSTDGKQILLFKTDLIGNLSWSKTFGGTADETVYDMKGTIDGGFVIAGETKSFPTSGNDTSNAFLMKVDNSGNILWSHQYGGNGRDAAFAVVETNDSGFVATGFTTSFGAGDEDVLAFRVDKMGNQVWKESLGGTGSDFGRAVCATASGNAFIITGNTNGFSAPGKVVYVLRIAGNGTFAWSKMYDFPTVPVVNYERIGYDVTVNGNNEYLITGKIGKGSIGDAQALVMSTDSTGGIINWCNSYYQNSGDCSAYSIEHSSDGGYVIGGTMGNYIPSIIKIDNAGNRMWDKIYTDQTLGVKGYGFAATQDANHQYILTGYTNTPPFTDTSIILVKTDSIGNVYCNSQNSFLTNNTADSVTITAVLSTVVFGGIDNAIVLPVNGSLVPTSSFCNSGVEENNSPLIHFTLAPNPLTNSSVLSTQQNISSGIILRVYDSFGRIVLEKPITNNQTEILRDHFSVGMYYYVISGKEGMIDSGKFIVE